jgi:hypothetical protein
MLRSGWSHLRYDHERRPTLVDVRCPKCHGKAVATEPCHDEGYSIVGEGSCEHWEKSEWRIVCLTCPFRNSGKSYFEIGELFYRIVSGDIVLWAWNRDHLIMLLDLLSKRPITSHKYASFATYAERDWLTGSRRRTFVKAIEKFLQD